MAETPHQQVYSLASFFWYPYKRRLNLRKAWAQAGQYRHGLAYGGSSHFLPFSQLIYSVKAPIKWGSPRSHHSSIILATYKARLEEELWRGVGLRSKRQMLKFLSYLSKTFLTTWLMTVFGFLVLIGLLDSLANGGDIMSGEGGFADTFRYMMLRAPVIFDRIFIFTIVFAILVTYVKLIRQHELVALLGFGISVPKQIMLLTPIVLSAGFSSITIIDYTIAPAVRSLQAWGIGEYKIKNITPENPLWLEDNGRIVRAEKRISYEELGNLEIYKRSDTGQVEDVLWAEKAVYKGDMWELKGVQLSLIHI